MDKEKDNWVRIGELHNTLIGMALPWASANMEDSAGNKQVKDTTYCANGKVLHSGLSSFFLAEIGPAIKVLDAHNAGFVTLDQEDQHKFHLGNLPSPLQQRCDEGEKSVLKRLTEWLAR